ncbi:UbiA prenyltransferase family [Mycena galopus ATCC 62051]|nr:UbiA prenyltransferase family [Mycena galopus ATCC 62051]
MVPSTKTLYLFTRSDYKTIFFPVTIFATTTAPVSSTKSWLVMLLWVWTHLLQANVSNQNYSADEDIVNKPWRPLPSGRVTERQTCILRWTLVFINLAFSAVIARSVMYTSLALALVEFVHDDLGLSYHPVLKNICNIGGYGTFEMGATLILSKNHTLDYVAMKAITLTALLIFTTIHAQDFADCEGDMQSGRRTLPIVFPVGSRVYLMFMVIAWSVVLCAIWDVGTVAAAAITAAGTFIGWRYFDKRAIFEDEQSYLFYNIWLVSVNLLPANARFNLLRY